MQVTTYQGHLVGTVYTNKLIWAAFDPKEGKVHYTELNGAPSSETLDNGFGPSFNPFYRPSETELEYCFKLGQWWSAIQEQDKSSSVVQIPIRSPRRFQLIQDMEENKFSDIAVYVSVIILINCSL